MLLQSLPTIALCVLMASLQLVSSNACIEYQFSSTSATQSQTKQNHPNSSCSHIHYKYVLPIATAQHGRRMRASCCCCFHSSPISSVHNNFPCAAQNIDICPRSASKSPFFSQPDCLAVAAVVLRASAINHCHFNRSRILFHDFFFSCFVFVVVISRFVNAFVLHSLVPLLFIFLPCVLQAKRGGLNDRTRKIVHIRSRSRQLMFFSLSDSLRSQ